MVKSKALFVLVVIFCISRSVLSFESDDEQDYLKEKRLFRRDTRNKRWSRYFGTSLEEGSNEWYPYLKKLPRIGRGLPQMEPGLPPRRRNFVARYTPFKLLT